MTVWMQFLSAEGDLEDDYDGEVLGSLDTEQREEFTGEKLMVLAFLRLAIRDKDTEYFESDSYEGLSFRFLCDCFNVEHGPAREHILRMIEEKRRKRRGY